jgi:hypothetical protein
MPAHGRYVGAKSTPIEQTKAKPGDRRGQGWRRPGKRSDKSRLHYVLTDSNYWKSFIHDRLAVGIGDPGALTFWQAEPYLHEMLADHLVAESRTTVEAKGRRVDEWTERPDHPDNHLFDCLAGCAAAAAYEGCRLPELQQAARPAPRPRRVTYFD